MAFPGEKASKRPPRQRSGLSVPETLDRPFHETARFVHFAGNVLSEQGEPTVAGQPQTYDSTGLPQLALIMRHHSLWDEADITHDGTIGPPSGCRRRGDADTGSGWKAAPADLQRRVRDCPLGLE